MKVQTIKIVYSIIRINGMYYTYNLHKNICFKCNSINVVQQRNSDLALLSNFNPIALRKAKIAYNFGLSECNRVKVYGYTCIFSCHYFS